MLDEDGKVSQEREVLTQYGLQSKRLKTSCHTLSMTIRSSLFDDLGGFREKLTKYPTHDDGNMKRRLKALEKSGDIRKCPDEERERILVFPNGRFCGDRNYNPFGLFHTVKR